MQTQLDEEAVLHEAISDEFDPEVLLETDETLSYCRPGVSQEVVRKLRRGDWIVQAQIDLHGMRREEAREALAEFIRESVKRGLRCLRVIHGKGLGSIGKEPVLKGKVRAWLVQKSEVIAFCQARPHDGGAGAVVVLLQPGAAPAHTRSLTESPVIHPRLTLALTIMEALAIFAYAHFRVSSKPKTRRLDAVGTFLVAIATAFGGGTLRDVLLERRPFYWVEHQDYLIAIFVMSLFAPTLLKMTSRLLSERVLLVADAVGLGLFSIAGTSIAHDAQMPWFTVGHDGRADRRVRRRDPRRAVQRSAADPARLAALRDVRVCGLLAVRAAGLRELRHGV